MDLNNRVGNRALNLQLKRLHLDICVSVQEGKHATYFYSGFRQLPTQRKTRD